MINVTKIITITITTKATIISASCTLVEKSYLE